MENIDVMMHRVQKNTEEIHSLRERTDDHENELKEVRKDVQELKMGQKINEHEIIKVRESIKTLTDTLDKQEKKQSDRHKEFYDRFEIIKDSMNKQNTSLKEDVRRETADVKDNVHRLEKAIQGWGVKIFGGIVLYIVYQLIANYLKTGGS